MKIKKYLFIALMFIFAGSAAFAGTIEITSPYYGEDFYAYNCDSVYDFNVKFMAEEKRTELFFTVKTPDKLDSFKLASQLSKIERLVNFSISDKDISKSSY